MINAKMATLKLLIFLGVLINFANSDPKFGGENVCNKTATIRKDKTVEVPIKYQLKYQGMCGILPCTKTRTESRMDSKLKTTLEEVQVATCCPGYSEMPDGQCIPICNNPCNNGKCILPGLCKCSPEPTESLPGFVGHMCNRFTCLANDRWGAKCDRECNCSSNSYCSASTGKCLCHAGWRGANCTEECDSTMNCNEVGELPPIIEPEVNAIHNVMGSSQKLEALAPRALSNDLDESNQGSQSIGNLMATHLGINLLLTIVTSMLIVAVLLYRRRLNQIKNELYYAGYYPSSGGSDYSSDSAYSQGINPNLVQHRPRMPTPLEDDFLSKNLSFTSATRNILLKEGNQSNKHLDDRDKFVVDPKIESHLITSQKSSQQNVYSDIESNFNDKSYNTIESRDSTEHISQETLLDISRQSAEEHLYQVPRFSATRVDLSTAVAQIESNFGLYENKNESNLYEEIKPISSNNPK